MGTAGPGGHVQPWMSREQLGSPEGGSMDYQLAPARPPPFASYANPGDSGSAGSGSPGAVPMSPHPPQRWVPQQPLQQQPHQQQQRTTMAAASASLPVMSHKRKAEGELPQAHRAQLSALPAASGDDNQHGRGSWMQQGRSQQKMSKQPSPRPPMPSTSHQQGPVLELPGFDDMDGVPGLDDLLTGLGNDDPLNDPFVSSIGLSSWDAGSPLLTPHDSHQQLPQASPGLAGMGPLQLPMLGQLRASPLKHGRAFGGGSASMPPPVLVPQDTLPDAGMQRHSSSSAVVLDVSSGRKVCEGSVLGAFREAQAGAAAAAETRKRRAQPTAQHQDQQQLQQRQQQQQQQQQQGSCPWLPQVTVTAAPPAVEVRTRSAQVAPQPGRKPSAAASQAAQQLWQRRTTAAPVPQLPRPPLVQWLARDPSRLRPVRQAPVSSHAHRPTLDVAALSLSAAAPLVAAAAGAPAGAPGAAAADGGPCSTSSDLRLLQYLFGQHLPARWS